MLDELPADWTFAKAARTQGNECAMRLDELVRPGRCDGLMIYASTDGVWQDRIKPIFTKHADWRYFSQLSYPGNMRLDGWAATCRRIAAPDPWKQGFFFYSDSSQCSQPSGWTDPNAVRIEAAMKNKFVRIVPDPKEGRVLRISPDIGRGVCSGVAQFFAAKKPAVAVWPGKNYRWSVHIKTVGPERRHHTRPKAPAAPSCSSFGRGSRACNRPQACWERTTGKRTPASLRPRGMPPISRFISTCARPSARRFSPKSP